MGVRWDLSSWAAYTSCVEWGGSLQQTLAPPASVAYRQEPAAWSPGSDASNFTCEKLEERKDKVTQPFGSEKRSGHLCMFNASN